MTTEGYPSGPPRARAEAADAAAAAAGDSSTAGGPGVASGQESLAAALAELRDVVLGARYALSLPSAASAAETGRTIVRQLEDYLFPRLDRLDAPLLAVVAGSTGAGKSTLVNSLVRVPVSPSGVLRPTTRAPVLVCNPEDMPWFAASQLLPGLSRATAATDDPHTLRVISAPALASGVALLDAPDIDSVVGANRDLAEELLATADLCLFVTTASRYADAVPWGVLRAAKDRGTTVALILDRTPEGAEAEITPHLREMLTGQGLAGVPLFVVPESRLDGQGLLGEAVGASLRGWLARLAEASETRTAVVRRTVGGAIDAIESAATVLASAADEQVAAAWALVSAVRSAYRQAEATVEVGVAEGAVLRGEVFTRWQEMISTGEVLRAARGRLGRLTGKTTAAVTRRTDLTEQFGRALETSLAALLSDAVIDAAARVGDQWRANPAGAALLETAGSDLTQPAADLPTRVQRLIRDWRRGVCDAVRDALAAGRGDRADSYTVDAAGLLAMVLALAPDEAGRRADAAAVARKVLKALFDGPAVRDLRDTARTDLLTRFRALLAEESARCQETLDAVQVDETAGDRFRKAANKVVIARLQSGLPSARSAPVSLPDAEPASDAGAGVSLEGSR